VDSGSVSLGRQYLYNYTPFSRPVKMLRENHRRTYPV
jgi:hypothetical protein